MVLEERA
jgi:nucleotide-binding universal stress UspA family protein